MQDFECPDCRNLKRSFQLKLISTGRWDIKYVPQVKETCNNCGKYIRFAPQTPELISKFNKALESLEVIDD